MKDGRFVEADCGMRAEVHWKGPDTVDPGRATNFVDVRVTGTGNFTGETWAEFSAKVADAIKEVSPF